MTSKDYLKQIAESKGVCPLTNEVKDNALLFPIGFEKIFQDLDRLEKLEKAIKLLKTRVKMFEIYREPKSRYYYLYIGGRIVFLSREEYELLKEVLENDK